MTKASGAAGRAAAARVADGLLARRAARFQEREKQLRRLVTDYHHAAAQAEKIHSDMQARAAKIAADTEARIAALRERADKEASAFEEEAHAAVRAILQFGEPREVVADLTKLPVAQVRVIERAAAATPRQGAAHTTRQPDARDAPPTQTTR